MSKLFGILYAIVTRHPTGLDLFNYLIRNVRMIQDMSDENVGFLLEVIQRLIPKKTYTSVIYPSQKSDEKMHAFKELVVTRYEAKKYLPDDFDPDAELEAARKERYGSID